MRLPLRLFATLLILTLSAPAAFAQSHFTTCASRTGNSAVLLVPEDAELKINGDDLREGDEIAVFTEEGICAGAITWENKHAILTIWGDDSMLPDKQGFDNDEIVGFRVWQAGTATEFAAEESTVSVEFSDTEPFLSIDGRYKDGAIMLLASLTVETEVVTSVEGGNLVAELQLSGNYPNPFSTSTTIAVSIPKSADVSIGAYNLLGQEVASIYDGRMAAGSHTVSWDASNLPSGLYLLRLESGGAVRTTRAVVAR